MLACVSVCVFTCEQVSVSRAVLYLVLSCLSILGCLFFSVEEKEGLGSLGKMGGEGKLQL